jgi:hypothetical protein
LEEQNEEAQDCGEEYGDEEDSLAAESIGESGKQNGAAYLAG